MRNDTDLVTLVYDAKADGEVADELIGRYLPFIRAEASRVTGRFCTEQDDAVSISMIAFYEAVQKYEVSRGNFLSYASLLIRSRLIDELRKEKRREAADTVPLEGIGDKAAVVSENCNPVEELLDRDAAAREIEEFSHQLRHFGLTLFDVAEQCPKQTRVLRKCQSALHFVRQHQDLIRRLIETKKLPIKDISEGAGVSRKTLERHRNYMIALMLVYSNGYESIRTHLAEMNRDMEGGAR